MPDRFLYYGQLSCAFLIWSSWLIPVRYLSINAYSISFLTCLWASVFWGLYCLYKFKSGIFLKKKNLASLFLLACFFILNMLTYLGALKYTTGAIAVLTHYTAPVFVAILAPVFLKERLTKRVITGLLLSLTGFITIFYTADKITEDSLKGALLGLASGFFYALIIIIAKKALLKIKEEFLLFYQNLFSFILFIPFLPFIEINLEVKYIFYLGGLSFIYSVVASKLYVNSLKNVEGIRASIIGYIEPLGTIVWGFIFFQESITIRTILGGILILFSGYLVTTKE
ncbi:MAG: DMT family transporter [Proteobacteria bacterium]|nr:DMT family transporter [Pseudomonadota bacterium]